MEVLILLGMFAVYLMANSVTKRLLQKSSWQYYKRRDACMYIGLAAAIIFGAILIFSA